MENYLFALPNATADFSIIASPANANGFSLCIFDN